MPGYTLPRDTTDKYNDKMDTSNGKRKGFKYGQALKQMIPIRPTPKRRDILPTRYAGTFSFISVNWLTSVMWKAYKNKIQPQDIWTLPKEESSKENGDRLQRIWNEEVSRAKDSGREPMLWKAVWRFCKTRILVCQLFAVFIDISFFLGPMVFLKMILDYINSPGIDQTYGTILLVAKTVISTVIPIILFNASYLTGMHTSSRLTGALQAMIYRKILTLKTGGENLSAQVTNLSTNDMERIFEACVSCVFLIEVPLVFVICLSYCIYAMGIWSTVGFGVYLFFYPIMGLIAKCQSIIRQLTIKETDRRVALMSEILNSIRLIKMYAWEEPFAKKIAGIRDQEMKRHRVGALLSSITNTLTPSIGILATIATLFSFTLTGNSVTSAEAFTMLSLFNLMGFTVSLLPYVMRCLAEAYISVKRIQTLLILPEHHHPSAGKDSAGFAIQIENAHFAWEVSDISYQDEGRIYPHIRERKFSSGDREPCEEALDSPILSRALGKHRDSVTGSMASIGDQKQENVSVNITLFRINLSVPHRKLIGICGSIGSGKSSLISAICGDMKKARGDMYINGKVALVTQQAWIYSGTLRDNILLGSDYQEEKYLETINNCCLKSDLELLPAGDKTEIGDRGVNLSGGQKQRVNLARAVYSDRDIYLLDDPLSAVDTKVANAIFHNCIKGHLKGKTVLLVTHALHLLEQCDDIIVMQDGVISEHGTHSQLLEQKGDYFLMVGGDSSQGQHKRRTEENQNIEEDTVLPSEVEEGMEADGKLTSDESRSSGSVSKAVYKTFVKVCGGWCISSCLLAGVVIFVVIKLLNMIWLQNWLDAGDGEIEDRQLNATLYNLTLSEDELKGSIIHHPLLWMYQTVYGVSFLALILVGILKGVGIAFSVLKGASRLHNAMFNSILRSPMSFFDTTPSGRILNRFSRDLDELDVRIPFFLEFVIQGVLGVTSQIILLCTIYVWFTIPLVIVFVLFMCVDLFLNAGVRELKRIDNTRKSPVIQHFGSSLSGLSVIRTFDQQDLFAERMHQYLDDHSAAQLVFRLSSRWYVFRTDVLAMIINTCLTGICIFTKGSVSTASAGLALSTMSGVSDFFPFLMKMKTEFQSRFTAVERLTEYSYGLSSEAPQEDPGKPAPRGWPEYGCVELKKVCLRYRPDLPLVLHDIEATFNPGQKIGVVGRTGAGKSSLIATLLRLAEVESGSVVIDGVDVASLGLHTLRSAVSVIPQDPVLFQGSIRYNLDPFEEHSDVDVWEALEQSNLKRVVQQQKFGLQSPVATAGENFSVGERQLICLTRALLRKSKILLLDEATASVDLETDQMIQTTIRKAFVQSTVITIAHRLNTITTYDKILVLRDGRVVEFDTPTALITTQGSLFREMMLAMGVSTVEEMRSLT